MDINSGSSISTGAGVEMLEDLKSNAVELDLHLTANACKVRQPQGKVGRLP